MKNIIFNFFFVLILLIQYFVGSPLGKKTQMRTTALYYILLSTNPQAQFWLTVTSDYARVRSERRSGKIISHTLKNEDTYLRTAPVLKHSVNTCS